MNYKKLSKLTDSLNKRITKISDAELSEEKQEIIDWILENYSIAASDEDYVVFKNIDPKSIRFKGNVVSINSDLALNPDATSITNGKFVWGTVQGFYLIDCTSLTSLEGAPQSVGGDFLCPGCTSLTSLEGAPQSVGVFDCQKCTSLTSLQGAPKSAKSFLCDGCTSLTSIQGAPQSVEKDFTCQNCKSLTSLQGAPQEIGGVFDCRDCKSLTSLQGAPKSAKWFLCDGYKFTEEDVRKVSNVKKVSFSTGQL